MLSSIRRSWANLPNWGRLIVLLVIIVVVPPIIHVLEQMTGFGLLTELNRALIYVVLALGLNIVVGFAGLLDLGYAAFFAIGAYAFGVMTWPTLNINASFFIAIWLCAVVAALFGIFVGTPTLKLRGDYLAIVTLAFGEIIPILIRNLNNININITIFGQTIINITKFNLTNGPLGMNPLGRPNFGFFEGLLNLPPGRLAVAVDPTFWYFVIVILVVIVLFAARRLENSRLGRAWKAIREDETAAEFMGIDITRTKLSAFGLGAAFSGLAGAVFASMLGVIFPDLFQFQVSIYLLIIVILSGAGNIWGVLLGGILISSFDGVFLAQVLPKVFPNSDIQSLRWVFFGAGLIIIMLFRPQGLFGASEKSPVAAAKGAENG